MGHSRQRGASLIELLVALALLSGIAVLTGQMVVQSTRLMDTAARASKNPDLVIATEWVRRDLYEAAAVMGAGTGWNDGPLVMATQYGGWTAFGAVEGELLRTNALPGGLPADNRVVLNGVAGWRWRSEDGVVEIELKAFANPQAHENLTGAANYRLERRTERLILALRGRLGGAAW